MKKWIVINFDSCQPATCDTQFTKCLALDACTRGLLVQEGKAECPMLLSQEMCSGCGKCIEACPFKALTVSRGL